MAISKISTLITVAVAAEALLSTCEWDDGNDEEFVGVKVTNEEVENLFNLRQDAASRASEILSSFVNSKPQRAKKLKARDVNADESNLSKKKKSKRSKDDDDEEMDRGECGMTTAAEVNLSVKVKNRKLIEEAIISLTPALPQDFLASALRRFGAGAESKTNRVSALFVAELNNSLLSLLTKWRNIFDLQFPVPKVYRRLSQRRRQQRRRR